MSKSTASNQAGLVFQFVIFLILAAVLFVLFKANINSGWDKVTLGVARGLLTGAVYGLFFFATKRSIWPADKKARFWLCVSAFCKSTSLLFMLMAFELLPASYIAIVLAFGPLGGMVISHILFHDDPLTVRNIAGMCLSIVGIVLLILSKEQAAQTPVNLYLGTLYIFCSMVFGGILPNSDKKAIGYGATVGQTSFFSIVPAIPFFLLFYAILGGTWPDFHQSRPIVLILVMSTVAVFIMPLRRSIIRKVKISTLCMLDNIQPMDNVIFAALFLGEKISLTMIGCMFLVLVGVTLARAQKSWLPFRAKATDIDLVR